jgi:hypothetical protein
VTRDAPVIGTPQLLFQVPFRRQALPQRNVFDVTPDGQRFLVNTTLEGDDPGSQINWVLNWAAELDR